MQPVNHGPAVQNEQWMAERLAQNEAQLAALEQHVVATGDNPFGLPPFDLHVSPGLVNSGEEVTLVFTIKRAALPDGADARMPDSVAQLQADYLNAMPGEPETLVLQWLPAEDGGRRAKVRIKPARSGNWRVVWHVQGHRISRSFAVVAGPKLVVTIWVGSNRPLIDDEIHQYDLAGDTWVGDGWSVGDKTPMQLVDYLEAYARRAWQYGDCLTPVVNASFILPGIRNSNLFKLPIDVQRRGLAQVQRAWRLLGLGALDIIASYTIGHATVGVLKELGVKIVNSLCTWQNVRDGLNSDAWLINHVGMPNAPYYVADDDFRKVPPGRSELMAFSMGTTSNTRMYDFFAHDGCVTNTMPSQRYAGNNAISANIDRFFTVADSWLHDVVNNDKPLPVTVALENFVGSPDWQQANREAVDYLVRRAGEGRLVFAGALAVAEYYQRHYAKQPRNVFFQHDALCGMSNGYKPVHLPDRIETSDERFHSLHLKGQPLPQLLWDYTCPWNNPEWDDQIPLRNLCHHVLPEAIAADKVPDAGVPRQADLRGVEAGVRVTKGARGVTVNIAISLPKAVATVPVALWDLPLKEIKSWPAELDVLPVRDGWTGAMHAIVVLKDMTAGRHEVTLDITGPQGSAEPVEFESGPVAARMFRLAEGTRTYLWHSENTHPCKVAIKVPPDAYIRYNDGSESRPDEAGQLWAELDDVWRKESPSLLGATLDAMGGQAVLGKIVPLPRTSFVQKWSLSELQEGRGNLEGLAFPADQDNLKFRPHPMPWRRADLYWIFRSRKADTLIYCAASLHCDEPMELAALLGFDGPIKIWVDGVEVFHQADASGPAVMDSVRAPMRVSAGQHEVLVAMGSNNARSCGFYLRFERTDLSPAQLAGETKFIMPLNR